MKYLSKKQTWTRENKDVVDFYYPMHIVWFVHFIWDLNIIYHLYVQFSFMNTGNVKQIISSLLKAIAISHEVQISSSI